MAVSIKLNDEERKRLRALAEAKQRTPHHLMKEAIRQYLGREEARESFRQEAMQSWSEFRETGRHVTGEELTEWLDGWGKAAEPAPPKCHD
jgi:predicted transcriptional regulator